MVSPKTERRLRLWLLYYSSLLTYCQMNLQLICALWHWYTVSSVPNLGLVCDTGQNGSCSCLLALFILMPNLRLRNLLVTKRFSSHKEQDYQSYSCRHYAIANLSHCWAKSEQKYHSTSYREPPRCDKKYAVKKVCALVSHPKWEIANAPFFLCSFYLFFDCCFARIDRSNGVSFNQTRPICFRYSPWANCHLFKLYSRHCLSTTIFDKHGSMNPGGVTTRLAIMVRLSDNDAVLRDWPCRGSSSPHLLRLDWPYPDR